MRNDRTFHSIQLLRAIAATLVVLFHAHQAFDRGVGTLFAQESYLFEFGAVGVHIFFVISGFIMVLTGTTPGRPYKMSRFLGRRFQRIFPMYWLCALAYIGAHAAMNQPYDMSPGSYLRALLLWPEDSGRLIGPAWTLSFEMYFYICFGMAMILGLTRGLIALTAVFLSAIAMGQLVPGQGPAVGLVTNLLLVEFLAGALIGWLVQTGRLPLRWGAATTCAGLLLFALGIVLGYRRLPSAVTWGIPSAVLVFGLVSWELEKGASKGVRLLSRLGDSSYVLYLIHVLTISVALQACRALGWWPSPLAASLLLSVIAMVLAEGIHRGVEVHLLALMRHGQGAIAGRKRSVREVSDAP